MRPHVALLSRVMRHIDINRSSRCSTRSGSAAWVWNHAGACMCVADQGMLLGAEVLWAAVVQSSSCTLYFMSQQHSGCGI
jgi:hypothetical protein